MNGFFNVHKPGGLTSHDVIDRIRRASHVRRVGHAGTLDPAAEGVLLVCVGPATRLSEYLMAGEKSYRATIRLGVSTTTDDAAGEVIATTDATGISLQQVEAALAGQVGCVSQVPPMYSALKVAGKPLYELARAGIEIERAARQIEIHEIKVVDWQSTRLVTEIRCGKGTYVRTIAHDLGARLGCGAHLEHLLRTAVGRWAVADAVPLDLLLDALRAGEAGRYLQPPDAAVEGMFAVTASAGAEARLTRGSYWRPLNPDERPEVNTFGRVYSEAGVFLGVAAFDVATDHWQPIKVLVPATPVGHERVAADEIPCSPDVGQHDEELPAVDCQRDRSLDKVELQDVTQHETS